MSWLDKLLGRDKKSGEMSSDSPMKSEDMSQGQGGMDDMGTPASAPEQPAQEGQESPPGSG